MLETIVAHASWRNAVIIILLIACGVFYFWLKKHYERTQVKQFSKMTREFRQEQANWLEERKRLEQYIDKLNSELEIAHVNLNDVKQRLDQGNSLWGDERQNLIDEIQRLNTELKDHKNSKTSSIEKLTHVKSQWQQTEQQLRQENVELKQQAQNLQAELATQQQQATQSQTLQDKLSQSRQQIDQLQSDKELLEDKLSEQQQWASQIQQALEEEITELNNRLQATQQKDSLEEIV